MIKPTTTIATDQLQKLGLKSMLDPVSRPREESFPVCQRYLTTSEAAKYLRRSVSWLLRCGEIPFLPGRPNLYSIRDLDAWFEANKYVPRS
jgi:hypothetical protein